MADVYRKRLLVLEQTLKQLQEVVMQLFAGYQAMARYLDETTLGGPGLEDVIQPPTCAQPNTPPEEPHTSPEP